MALVGGQGMLVGSPLGPSFTKFTLSELATKSAEELINHLTTAAAVILDTPENEAGIIETFAITGKVVHKRDKPYLISCMIFWAHKVLDVANNKMWLDKNYWLLVDGAVAKLVKAEKEKTGPGLSDVHKTAIALFRDRLGTMA